jgi:hypothetical protein
MNFQKESVQCIDKYDFCNHDAKDHVASTVWTASFEDVRNNVVFGFLGLKMASELPSMYSE